MSTSKRATLDTTADIVGADRLDTPLLLTHTEAALAASRGDVITLERTDIPPRPEDIAISRLRALAKQLAGKDTVTKLSNDDAALADADEVIEPVSLAAITAMRRAQRSDDGLTLPTREMPVTSAVVTVPDAPSAVPSDTTPAMTDAPASPAVLRLASEPSQSLAATSDAPVASKPDTTEEADAAGPEAPAPAPLIRRITQLAESPMMLADQSMTDIRLVDLIRRQQTLLDQLHRFPPTSEAPDASDAAYAPLPETTAPEPVLSELSMVDRLAPAPMELTFSGRPRTGHHMAGPEMTLEPPAALPPPLPPDTAAEMQSEDAEPHLPERAPIIIERARAERSGRHDPNGAATSSSGVPAFAAGIGLALAIAGTLFYLL